MKAKSISLEEFFTGKKSRRFIMEIGEDYGNAIELKYQNKTKVHKWLNCSNNLLIQEDSLQRTLKIIQDESFAIFTAYRKEFSKEQNILRNRKLRAFLNQNRMGVHQLVGHWDEKQKDGLIANVVERSYLVEKPDDMTDKDFCDIVIGCLTIDGSTQDGAIVKFKSKGNDIYYLDAVNSSLTKIGSKLNFNKDAIKLASAYSQHVKKMNMPFVFDGEEVPQTINGMKMYRENGYKFSL